jgi:hypothetical protein
MKVESRNFLQDFQKMALERLSGYFGKHPPMQFKLDFLIPIINYQ